MRSINTVKRVSIFGKLTLAFLLVITPLYVLGIYISNQGSTIVDKEISKSLQQQLQFYLLSLETEIDRMTALQREFMNDEDLDELSMMHERMSTYERLSAIKRLQTRLKFIQESSMYIESAQAYIPSIHRVVSSTREVYELNQVMLDERKEGAFSSTHPLIFQENELYIREYYPSPFNLDIRNPNFVLELKLSIPSVNRFLEQLPGYEQGGAAIISESATIMSDKHRESYQIIESKLDQHLWMQPKDTGAWDNGLASTMRLETGQGVLLVTYQYSSSLNAYLLVYVPEHEVMGPLQKYQWYMWIIFGIGLLAIPIFAYWIYRIIHRPLRKMVGAFRKVESGILQLEIKHNSNDEFHYLYEKFNYMVAHLNTLIYEVYEQKIHLQRSELKQLQSQINPHFLYNSFYLLYRMIKAYDNDNALQFTKFLGDYYQYITRDAQEEVQLQEEIRHVKAYIEIQAIRFGDRIKVEMADIPDSIRMLAVPRLILQPIIENAYQHAFQEQYEDCQLTIQFKLATSPGNQRLVIIEVRDNGSGMTDEKLEQLQRKFAYEQHEMEVTGLLNVHRRLRLKYGELAGLSFERNEAGLTVLLTIPDNEKQEVSSCDTKQ